MTDNRGRKRFHGAFEGGFSAGYFNTVGSAHGWEPSQFRSMRDAKHEGSRAQSVRDFLDDDELAEYDGAVLQTKTAYDTFGRAAKSNLSRVVNESHASTGIPLLVPDVMVTPVSEGVGVKLLLRMGWRQGKGLDYKDSHEIQRLIRDAKNMNDIEHVMHKGLRISNTKMEQLEPKIDMFGLGYDPFMGAEEFRYMGKKVKQVQDRKGIAFGTGIVEDHDDVGMIEDYVSRDETSRLFAGGLDASGKPLGRHQGLLKDRLGDRLALEGYTFEIQDDLDDASRDHPILLQRPDAVKMLSNVEHEEERDEPRHGMIPGFVSCVQDSILPAIYPRPRINSDYSPSVPACVKQVASLIPAWSQQELERPHKVPSDPLLKGQIDQIALQVARSGPDFERIAMSTDSGDMRYHFVTPGDEFHPYYLWRVQRFYRMVHPEGDNREHMKQMDSIQRGSILGEPRLEEKTFPTKEKNYLKTLSEKDRKVIEERMASTFVKPTVSTVADTEKLHPGLSQIKKTMYAQPAATLPSDRKIVTVFDLSKPLVHAPVAVSNEDLEKAQKAALSGIPIRRIEPWNPAPLLCKRLGIEVPHTRVEILGSNDSGPASQEDIARQEIDDPVRAAREFLDMLMQESKPTIHLSDIGGTNIEKPTDLFQIIFEQGEEEQKDAGVNEYKPMILSEGKKEAQPKSKSKSGTYSYSGRHGKPTKNEVPGKDVAPVALLDDERIKEALRIVEEAKRRKKKKKESKGKRSSKKRASSSRDRHRHTRDPSYS